MYVIFLKSEDSYHPFQYSCLSLEDMGMSDYFGKDVFKLGFGFMRLPRLADGTTDMEQIKEMVDRFIAAGGTYFDTAYVYGTDGDSETAIRDAVVKRYPRDQFTIATKLNVAKAKDEADAKHQFDVSMERTQAGYFDYYLLHALQENNCHLYDEYHLYLRQLKSHVSKEKLADELR